jgi:DNA-directed RNA polymerase specialized sigma24 family protein
MQRAMGFEDFYRAERDGLLRSLVFTLRDPDLALEVTDEAFARAYERWAELSDAGNRPGRVYRVALNLARNRWRRLSLERRKPPPVDPLATLFAQPGDYSVLLLRRVIDEQVRTTIVASSVADPEPGESPFVFVTRVAAAADLNGDGVMELATRAVYYEGAATAVLRVDSAGGVDELLTVGCGA